MDFSAGTKLQDFKGFKFTMSSTKFNGEALRRKLHPRLHTLEGKCESSPLPVSDDVLST